MRHSSKRQTAGSGLAVALMLLTACGDSGDATTTEANSIAVLDTASGDVSDTAPATGAAIGTQAPPDPQAPTDPPPPATLPETTPPAVSTVVLGGVVGGSSGGVGEDSTDSASEIVRNDDGSCTGWDSRRDDAWTADFTPGATVTILDADTDEEIGSGKILEGVAENVATDGGEQWQCWLRFEAAATRPAEQYAIRVGDARPVPLTTDPTRPGFVIGSISTPADSLALDACTQDNSSLQSVGDWSGGRAVLDQRRLVVVLRRAHRSRRRHPTHLPPRGDRRRPGRLGGRRPRPVHRL